MVFLSSSVLVLQCDDPQFSFFDQAVVGFTVISREGNASAVTSLRRDDDWTGD